MEKKIANNAKVYLKISSIHEESTGVNLTSAHKNKVNKGEKASVEGKGHILGNFYLASMTRNYLPID